MLKNFLDALQGMDLTGTPEPLAEAVRAVRSVAAASPATPAQAPPQGHGTGADCDASMSDSKRALSEEEADALLQELDGMDRTQKRARLMAAVQAKPVEATQVRA